MKKSKIQIRRAGLKERLHFLFTGEIPGYWQKANNDVRMTLVQALADPDFPFCNENKPETIKIIIDFLATSKFSYKTIEKYIFRIPLLPHEEKSLLSGLFIETQNPDYFPKPSETTKKMSSHRNVRHFNENIFHAKRNGKTLYNPKSKGGRK